MSNSQDNYSEIYPECSVHDSSLRRRKAMKVLAVLEDYLGDLNSLRCLDIGCSKGLMTKHYAEKFQKVVGIDIDKTAVEFAIQNNSSSNLEFYVEDCLSTGFDDESFDVVICTQIYEHVPDSRKLMSEIYRLLRAGGICYFAAANRLHLFEGHYNLPLLSVIPKSLAHIYLRILRRGDFYYENHLTFWGLKQLVSEFTVIDYTREVIKDPEKYHLTEMVRPGSLYQKIVLTVLNTAYWLSQSYIWLLQKRNI